jgi:hypothetical protein
MENGNWELETGNWKLATGKVEASRLAGMTLG